MTLRRRLYLMYIGMFTLILLGSLLSIFFIYKEYREDVFYELLESRIIMTTRLLFEVQTKDHNLVRTLDEKTTDAMFDEKVVIFNNDGQIVYSSINDSSISYSPDLLRRIKKKGRWKSIDGDREELGLNYRHDGQDYVALASALDITGLRMIDHLATALSISFAAGIAIMLVSSRVFVSRTLRPITNLSADISKIGPDDLYRRLEVPERGDEISSIAISFNETLDRLTAAFEFQSNFVHYASHELNTPVTVVQAIIDRIRSGNHSVEAYRQAMEEISEINERLTDLLTSLLLLAGLDSMNPMRSMSAVRMDDVLFDVAEITSVSHPETHLSIDLDVADNTMFPFEVIGISPLLRTAMSNLTENGTKYADDGNVHCTLISDRYYVRFRIITKGQSIPDSYSELIFKPFVRFAPAQSIRGRGLGLAIVRRIAEVHRGNISYSHTSHDENIFELAIPARQE
ncbi:MAG: HAMP domain-containing histidine kinase [Ignavibacteria bacterium]|nr:HAMP domain-containing histidine kinase [Ignavibacteria bacterium]